MYRVPQRVPFLRTAPHGHTHHMVFHEATKRVFMFGGQVQVQAQEGGVVSDMWYMEDGSTAPRDSCVSGRGGAQWMPIAYSGYAPGARRNATLVCLEYKHVCLEYSEPGALSCTSLGRGFVNELGLSDSRFWLHQSITK